MKQLSIKMSTASKKSDKIFPRKQIRCRASWETGYSLLLTILLLCGIKIRENNSRETILKSAVLKLFPFLMLMTEIYILWLCYKCFESDRKVLVSYAFFSLTSLVLWGCVYFKRHSIKECLDFFKTISCHQKSNVIPHRITINCSLCLATLFPVFCSIMCVISMDQAPDAYQQTYSFFVDVPESRATLVLLRLISALSQYILRYSIPGLVTVVCATMYYTLSDLVANFNATLLRKVDLEQGLRVLQMLHQAAEKVESTLSYPTFALLCSQLASLYITLVVFVAMDGVNLFASVVWEAMPSLLLVPLSVVGIVCCASRINSQHVTMLGILQGIHDELAFKREEDWKVLGLVKRLKENHFPPMTACGIVGLKPGLILSAFGSFLTYGLLILNISGK